MRNRLFYYRLSILRKLESRGISDYTILIVLSVLLGTVAGLVAVIFHSSIEGLTHLLFKNALVRSLPWTVILLPMLGMIFQRLMTRLAPREAGRGGVIDVIEAVSLRNGDIPLKTTLFHFFAPIICMGSGGTVGPEAPAAQTGAGAVSAVGKLLGLSDAKLRVFTAAGAGAAIAGVFNTPMAGVFFCIEVILLNEIRASALSVFLLTSVSASTISRMFLGNEPKFHFGELSLGPPEHLIFFLILGLCCGLLSVLFIKFREYSAKVSANLNQPLLSMAAVGLCMGIVGYQDPQLFGIGYGTINRILAGEIAQQTLILLLALKFVLVSLILAVGGFGGVFAPSLFMGAAFGSAFVGSLNALLNLSLHPTTFALVGMGAVLAGVNSVPITAILLLFEMTNDYRFILPLMVGVVGSHAVSHLVLGGSVYQVKLRHKGLHKVLEFEYGILHTTPVRRVVRKNITLVAENTKAFELVSYFLGEEHHTLYVTNAQGAVTGVINLSSMRHLIADSANLQMVIAQDVAEPIAALIDADDTLADAMPIFAGGIEETAVMENRDPRRIIGVLHHQDVLALLNQSIMKNSLTSQLAHDMANLQEDKIQTVLGFSLAKTAMPEEFIGKTPAELKIRNNYKIELLMIERRSLESDALQQILPNKDVVFHRGDRLIIYGKHEDILAFKTKFDSLPKNGRPYGS